MANYKTGAQRYNDRMDKIFEKAKSEKRGLVGNSGIKSHTLMGTPSKKPLSKERKYNIDAYKKALENKK